MSRFKKRHESFTRVSSIEEPKDDSLKEDLIDDHAH